MSIISLELVAALLMIAFATLGYLIGHRDGQQKVIDELYECVERMEGEDGKN